jgi:hypothetical protein
MIGMAAGRFAARSTEMPRLLSVPIWTSLLLFAFGVAGAQAAPISHIQVRIVTGAVDLGAGSYVELRIYEAGKAVRHLPLVHGESWPRGSTRFIPLTLSEPLDPRGVMRFSLFYRAASPQSPAWEIAAADVELPSGNPPERLLDATLSGVISQQGELATVERGAAWICTTDADCDDHRECNGHERCAPRTSGADARGCVKGTPLACPVNQVCVEGRGCLGADSITKSAPPQ